MPLNIIGAMLLDGPQVLPGWAYIRRYGPPLAVIAAIKHYFGGTYNTWERDMHGKVFIVTGGTSGVGAQTAFQLATKGAQVILLTRTIDDAWTVDFVDDLREKTNNPLVYAEQCDLALLHSVRQFATKWLDNTPPRRLDGVICCAAELIPPLAPRQTTVDGVERQMGVNYLAHFHLLTLLSPAIRVQPPDRDVRVVVATCALQLLGTVRLDDLVWLRQYPRTKPWQVYGSLKLMLAMFTKTFQRQMDAYERPDKTPCNVRITLVNPGVLRSASTRRFLLLGSVWGLIVYWLLWPVWFIFMKSAFQGSQLVVYAVNLGEFLQMEGGQFVHECRIVKPSRMELYDQELQDKVYERTVAEVGRIEKESARERKKRQLREAPKGEKNHKATEKATTARKRTTRADTAAAPAAPAALAEPAAPAAAATGRILLPDDIYKMPETPEELEAKLKILRDLLGTSR